MNSIIDLCVGVLAEDTLLSIFLQIVRTVVVGSIFVSIDSQGWNDAKFYVILVKNKLVG